MNGFELNYKQIGRLQYALQIIEMVEYMYNNSAIVSMKTVFGLLEKVSE
jgi:hypothetical protein